MSCPLRVRPETQTPPRPDRPSSARRNTAPQAVVRHGIGGQGAREPVPLADLATDELVERKRRDEGRRNRTNASEPRGGVLAEYALSEEQGNEIIMAARAHWFADEETADAGTSA